MFFRCILNSYRTKVFYSQALTVKLCKSAIVSCIHHMFRIFCIVLMLKFPAVIRFIGKKSDFYTIIKFFIGHYKIFFGFYYLCDTTIYSIFSHHVTPPWLHAVTACYLKQCRTLSYWTKKQPSPSWIRASLRYLHELSYLWNYSLKSDLFLNSSYEEFKF